MGANMINEDAKICISIAEKPGKFGLIFHNQGYNLLGLNYFYLPLKVIHSQLESTIQLVRDNFHACSVSMPHKINVIDYLDSLDQSAIKTGAVNTILKQEDGTLKGYNTDYFGAKTALENSLGSLKDKDVLLVGAGGVARAIGNIIKDLGGRLTITNRTENKSQDLAEKIGAEVLPWEERNHYRAYLLINATSVGMGTNELVVSKEGVSNFDAIMDVIVSPETELLNVAREQGKIVIPGTMMTIYQAVKQFQIYTSKELPTEFIERTIKKMGRK